MKFKVLEKNGREEIIDFIPSHIINAGYTGRDQAAVQAHVDELKEKGVPAPEKTPVYFTKFADRITQDEIFEVLDEKDHSGEVEFALFFYGGNVYVGVGSDHTDRALEIVDIPKAKQVYPNTISKELWRLDDVIDHWDDIIIRSFIKVDGAKRLFQEAKLTAMLDAAELITRTKALLADPEKTDGLVIYSGTVASLFNAEYSPYFESELEDPIFNRRLCNVYKLVCKDSWYKGN